MTPALAQASLFDSPAQADCPKSETASVRDALQDDAVSRLKTTVSHLGRCSDPVERIRSAVELMAAAEGLIAQAVREARSCGRSWRELGADLGVPFQTLFRRYGGLEPRASDARAAVVPGALRNERGGAGRA